MSKNIGDPYEQLGYLLTQVSFLKQRIVNAALRELDITYIQFVILAGAMELGDEGRIVTQQTISDERGLDKAMVSNVVKTLIEKGYLERESHPTDKRAYTLTLTETGKEKALKGKAVARRTDTWFFEGVDKAATFDLLTKLLENKHTRHEK